MVLQDTAASPSKAAPAATKEPPSSTKKRRSASHAAQQNVAQVNEQQSRDITYIVGVLQAYPAPLAAHVAGLLRDEVLQKAVQRAAEGPLCSSLGKILPPKMKKLRSLPSRTKLLAIMQGCPALANDVSDPPVLLPEGADGRILEFMLNASPEAKPPDAHTASNFEQPMLKVLAQRRLDMGDRLQSCSTEDLKTGKFGYFVWDKTDPTNVKTWSGLDLTDVISVEEHDKMSDLELIDNHSHLARLHSAQEDWSKGLMAVLRRQHPKADIVDPQTAWEYPDLCKEFEGMVPDSCKASKAPLKKKPGAATKAKMPRLQRKPRTCKVGPPP